MTEVHLPYKFTPRHYQLASWKALWPTGDPQLGEPGMDVTRVFILMHRRGGKDLEFLNLTNVKMGQRTGIYAHIFPTLTEGRKVIWEGMDRDGRPFLDYFPGHSEFIAGQRGGWVRRKRDDLMRIEVANGSSYTVLGADHPDSVRGMNIVGALFSEYAFFKGPEVWDIIRPMLAENGGWAAFITTPNGRNHSHALHKNFERLQRKGDPIYFSQTLTVDDTGAVDPARIQEDRDSGMSEEKIQSEYYCSYDMAVEGSFYGPALRAMRDQGRITAVPYNPSFPVDTYWDIGVRDATAIWFAQKIGERHRLIDFEWATGQGLPELAKLVLEKPYVYRRHLGPWDLAVREWSADHAVSRVAIALNLGIKFYVVPKRSVEDGISATRALLATTWIDEENCQLGIDALGMYQRKKLDGVVGPNNEGLYTNEPEHGWASHAADALRTGAMGIANLLDDEEWEGAPAPKIAMV